MTNLPRLRAGKFLGSGAGAPKYSFVSLQNSQALLVAGRLREFFFATLAVAAVTALSLVVEPLTGYLAVALLYLLLVVVLGARFNQGPVLTAATLSALLWNFLFIPPHFTFYIGKLHDAMMFAMFFVVALVMGHLTGRLRLSELTERKRERRTAALYELAHQAAFAPERDAGLSAAINHIESIFFAQAALVLRLPDHTLAREAHPVSSFSLTEKEQSVAAWAFSRRMPAGRFTDTLPDAEALHLPLQGRTAVMGVLSVRPTAAQPFDLSERELLEAFAVLIGLLLEKDHIAEAIKRAEILEASERLRHALLDSVSHELKTPLAAVQAGLTALEARLLGDKEKALAFQEIKGAVRRLNRVIDNLLDMTRIESGTLQPKLEWSDVEELVERSVELAGEALAGFNIDVDVESDLPMIKIDHALVEQALANLLVNAANWSDAGATIAVRARLESGVLAIAVLDSGPGIDAKDLPHLFEKFYRAESARPGGTGLGLSIVDGFIRAHGGSVRGDNRAQGGAKFEMRLPVETLDERQLESRA
jgi:two-component system sensor histidine kinase KdpD